MQATAQMSKYIHVSFDVSEADHEVMLSINGSYHAYGIEPKTAQKLVRWTMTQLKAAKEQYEFLHCVPYVDDQEEPTRKKALERNGFVELEGKGIFVWCRNAEDVPLVSRWVSQLYQE